MHRSLFMLFAVGALAAPLLFSPDARAQEQAPAPAQDPHFHNHDGFYLSLALGPTYVSSSMTTTATGGSVNDVTSNSTGSSFGTTINGSALGGQLLIGGTPVDGLVVGGGSMGNFAFSSTRSWGSNSRSMHGYSVGLLGPFVDYYLDPHEGVHILALAGLADAAENSSGSSATALWGFGGALGVGNEWWVSGDWGLGVLLRGQLARFSTGIDAGTYGGSPGNPDLMGPGVREVQTVWTLGVLMTATYH